MSTVTDKENFLEIEVKYKLEGSLRKWAFHFEKLLKVAPEIVDKEDTYYEINNFFFRIRKDKEGYNCNFKEKTIQKGLEVNFERETEINDISFWGLFLKKANSKVLYKKTKKGFSFFKPPFFLELVEVNPIGIFAEIEYLETTNSILEIKKEIEDFVSFLQIPSSSLEEKPYKDLLNF